MYCKRLDASLHERIERELRFSLKLQHYLNDRGMEINRTLVQFKGRELFSKIRREAADVMAAIASTEINAVPVDSDADSEDPITAELAEWALKQDLHDPNKGWETYLERAVIGAISARMWGVAVDWDANAGAFGEALYRNVDPTKFFLCPPYVDVWDLRLPWVIEEVDMRLEDAQRMEGWTNAKQLQADPLSDDVGNGGSFIDERGRVSLYNDPEPNVAGRPTGMVKILLCWSRFDKSVKTRTVDTRALPPDMQYAGCTTCGWRSDPGATSDQVCPQCLDQGNLTMAPLIGAERIEQDVLARRKGKRFEVIAPLQGLAVRDGDWPQDMRGFPYMMLSRFEHPRERCGVSDTYLDSSLQVMSNALHQRAYDQVTSGPNVMAVVGAQPKDAAGEDFQFTDEPVQVAYFEDPSTRLEHFNFGDFSPALGNLVQLIQNSFRSDIGTAEIGLSPNQSKDIPVGTINRIVESGSIPTDHFIQRVRRALAPFVGVISDIQRERWTDQRWLRYQGPDGLMRAKQIRGASIPNADFVFQTDPSLKRMDDAQQKALQWWYSLPPPLREVAAPKLGIPPTMVARVEQKEREMQQQMAPPMVPGQAPGGMPGMPGAQPAPAMAPLPMGAG